VYTGDEIEPLRLKQSFLVEKQNLYAIRTTGMTERDILRVSAFFLTFYIVKKILFYEFKKHKNNGVQNNIIIMALYEM